MRAAVLTELAKPFEIWDKIDIVPPNSGQVRVRVTNCGVCHSDLSLADGVFPAPTPIILGHEAAGVVDAVGTDVGTLTVGDHVILTPIPACGTCYWCVRGEYGVCVNAMSLSTNTFLDGTTGLSRNGEVLYRGVGLGGFGDYVVCAASGAIKIPDEVPLDVACVIGCSVQTGVGAVLNTARVEEGATVLVVGLGGIGLNIVQGARLAGASRIIAADPVASRRHAATHFGATDLVDPTTDDLWTRVMDITSVGVDYAFDAVGRASLIDICLRTTRNGGTTVCVGAAPMDDVINIAPAALFTLSEKKLIGCALGSCNARREIPRFINLYQSGRLDLAGLITHRRPLGEINEAFADMRAGRGIRTVMQLG